MINYFVRKNHFYDSDHDYYLGKATHIVGQFENFQSAKQAMYLELQIVLSEMIGNCFELNDRKNRYGLLGFMRHGMNSRLENYGYEYFGQMYYKGLKTIEDIELFNYKYPTSAVEIIFTQNDYLLSSTFNEEYFELLQQEVPTSQFSDEYGSSNQFLDKGLYVDELDYFNNVMQSECKASLVSLYNSINIKDNTICEEAHVLQLVSTYPNKIIDINDEGTVNIGTEITYEILFEYHTLLKIRPINFAKVKFSSIEEYDMSIYKDIVNQCLTYMLGPAPNSMQDILGLGFQSMLSLSKIFVEKVVTKFNLNETSD